LACNLYANDGSVLRFGPDEADAQNVVTDVTFGTEVPGWGWAEGSVKLSRPGGLSSLDANLFSQAHIYDESGQTVYRGRVAKLGRSGATGLEVELEGPLAHLDDDQTARMIYRDADLSNWGGMSRARKLVLDAASVRTVGDAESTFDGSGQPALQLLYDGGSWAASWGPRVEGWYDAGPGLLVSKFVATLQMSAVLQFVYSPASGMRCMVQAGDSDSVAADFYVVAAAAASQLVNQALTTARRCVSVELFYNNTGAFALGDAAQLMALWSNVAVYGNHGLTVRGTEPSAGFYASDVVADAIARWAPLVSVAPAGIEQSTYVIPHLAFRDFGATAREIIEAVSLYGASGFQPPDWGCYEDGFFWKTPGTYGRTWRLRRDQGAAPIDEGPTTETRCNGFVVTYTDASGDPRTVGPPGSGADYETDQLADTSPTNPVNAAGIPRRYGSRDVGITSQEGAVLLGTLLLKDANTRRYSGSVDLAGPVFDAAGNEYPPYMVRAGDYAVFEDDEDTTPKKIVSTNYSGGSTSASLDNKSTSIDTLLSQLDVAIKPAGF
jgi:hypothetical protein